ncbi:Coronatine-insensitive protein [Thalictrum thalictroides]|uniref:Coronatine-insensitive protein n=1 Tax=Thalictrum thalictroides TaxID=46969 RepID=A0A7J6WZE8_THATH|nr:Coronatine-insensitive protein [Thalictrum thalictroides]
MRISDVPVDSLECIMNYIDDPRDRAAMSLVCRLWYKIDALTRKHITIAFCYTTTPAHLRRFSHLESLKLKGKPRASMFNLMPEDWGGYAGPWINEISVDFKRLKSLHFRRMIVQDKDLENLASSHGQTLEALKLDKCSGFSTDGLLHITLSFRCLRHLFLEESTIDEKDGKWLHELALNNTVLETLNFYLTYLKKISIQDLELIARNCRSLVSIKISDDPEILNLKDFFQCATALEEFAGGSFGEQPNNYNAVILPQTLRRLGPSYIEKDMIPIVYPLTSLLKKLDLLYTFLDTEGHCQLIKRCPNLEILEARNVIGDRGLEVLAKSCKRLKRLRIERGEDEEGMEDEQGVVSQRGLSALAQGCVELEYIAIHVSDINNASLESIGTHCKNLCDFRLVLLDREEHITELPLDNGVRALLMGCKRLKRFAFYVRPGALTDVGLSYIGQYSKEVRWMLLGYVGESDAGILGFSKGCPNLQKLEMRGCCFTEHTLALAISQLTSLKYLWVQQLKAPLRSSDLSPMVRRYWNIELFPYTELARPDQILAYYSLAGQRRDCPSVVVPLDP